MDCIPVIEVYFLRRHEEGEKAANEARRFALFRFFLDDRLGESGRCLPGLQGEGNG